MLKVEEKALYFKIDTSIRERLDFNQIFGNDKPVTVEIGSGKGEFIAVHSRFHPERNFIGIELKGKRIITTLKKLDMQKNSNVRLLNLFVDKSITDYIAVGSIDEFIIYHPDPWPKTRHRARRMLQHEFLDILSLLLKKGGYLRISTDNAMYARQIVKLFTERKDFESVYADGYSMIPPEDHITTYFDDLQGIKGYETFFFMYKKSDL
jgi:tRNA (guanine-N7-)-methyltransferase